MFYVASKLLSFLTDPTFWIVACFVVSILLKKRRWKRIVFISGVSLFILMGNGALISWAEQRQVRNVLIPLDSGVVYEYALIQGGFGDFNPRTGRTQLFEEAERLIEPVRLYREVRVRKLFISGDGSFSNEKLPESRQVFIQYLKSLGVSEADIILDTEAVNTRQSAKNTRNFLGEDFNDKNSLLVTSAVHMFRTLKCYKKEGMNPVPFATSVPVPYKPDITNWNLSTGNLYRWQQLIHEWIGTIVYRIAGYV
jgi:uncharacterized SAM-binding protein YcdF (DUF218 family)